MATTVEVLCPDGRRVSIKTNPNAKLVKVLEEACTKKKYSSPISYELRRQNSKKALDLTLSMRLAGLPNHTKLELVKAARNKEVCNVTIALQLEDGKRLQHDFKSDMPLWAILEHWKSQESEDLPEIPEGQHPVFVYMRDEINKHGTTTQERPRTLIQQNDSAKRRTLMCIDPSPPTDPIIAHRYESEYYHYLKYRKHQQPLVQGEFALRNTTLYDLGLLTGRAVLRMGHKQIDEETLEAIKEKIILAKGPSVLETKPTTNTQDDTSDSAKVETLPEQAKADTMETQTKIVESVEPSDSQGKTDEAGTEKNIDETVELPEAQVKNDKEVTQIENDEAVLPLDSECKNKILESENTSDKETVAPSTVTPKDPTDVEPKEVLLDEKETPPTEANLGDTKTAENDKSGDDLLVDKTASIDPQTKESVSEIDQSEFKETTQDQNTGDEFDENEQFGDFIIKSDLDQEEVYMEDADLTEKSVGTSHKDEAVRNYAGLDQWLDRSRSRSSRYHQSSGHQGYRQRSYSDRRENTRRRSRSSPSPRMSLKNFKFPEETKGMNLFDRDYDSISRDEGDNGTSDQDGDHWEPASSADDSNKIVTRPDGTKFVYKRTERGTLIKEDFGSQNAKRGYVRGRGDVRGATRGGNTQGKFHGGTRGSFHGESSRGYRGASRGGFHGESSRGYRGSSRGGTHGRGYKGASHGADHGADREVRIGTTDRGTIIREEVHRDDSGYNVTERGTVYRESRSGDDWGSQHGYRKRQDDNRRHDEGPPRKQSTWGSLSEQWLSSYDEREESNNRSSRGRGFHGGRGHSQRGGYQKESWKRPHAFRGQSRDDDYVSDKSIYHKGF